MEDFTYTPKELAETIAKMHSISSEFYSLATRTSCHPFIEFCGLMNEYIKMCEDTLASGKDFTTTSIHSSDSLSIKPWQALYLAEKFSCIFGNTFSANPKEGLQFLNSAFPTFKHEPLL